MKSDALPARIAAELTSLIVSGDMRPQSHLTTPALAERYAVSRSPVREALRILESQGLVRQEHRRGYFVQPLSARSKAAALRSAGSGHDGPRAYYALAEDWVRDTIPEVVTESFLLQHYRIGRAELAAVLTRAAAEGWIERKAGYGWRFLPVAKTAAAQEQLYRMRMLMEPAAFLEPTFSLDRPMMERLRSDLEKVAEGANQTWPADRLHGIGVAFHEDLIRMSGNPFLLQAVQRVNRMRRLLEYRSMIDRGRVLQETHEHLAILEPLERGDMVETSFRMRMHIGRALARKRPAQAEQGQ